MNHLQLVIVQDSVMIAQQLILKIKKNIVNLLRILVKKIYKTI